MTNKIIIATGLVAVLLSGFTLQNARAKDADHSDKLEARPLADIPDFVEEAKAAGIDHTYDGPWEYYVGGGAAGFDCNGDRMPDLALAGGANSSALYINRSSAGGALKFEKVEGALPEIALDKVTGFYPIDFNNDGKKDLVALRVGQNLLLEGNGECSFKTANKKYAFDGGREWTTAFSAIFEKNNSLPTLAFGNYVDRSAPGSPWGTCHNNFLFRPDSKEAGIYGAPQVLSPGFCSLSMLFTDWNRSGQPDLRIANDRQYYRGGEEQLWRIEANRPARVYRSADGWQKVLIWGMGIAETDLDEDGLPEYALTSMGDTKLQELADDEEPLRPTYSDIAFEMGVTAHRPYVGDELKPSTGWHAEFSDFNNDGNTDLFIAKGNVEAMPDFASFDPDNLLLRQATGKFVEAGKEAGIAKPTKGRGAVIADFNADGMLDIAVVNRGSSVSLFRNQGIKRGEHHSPMGNWLAVELNQEGANHDAVGAVISVKTGNKVQTRRIAVGGGHASGHLGFLHIGLGVAERATLRIKWPDGEWSHEYRAFANHFVVIGRGQNQLQYWYPVNDTPR